MHFYPFEVTTPHIIYACLGGFIVLFGMFSLFLRERLYIGEACWAFLFGVIIGPYCANVFDPRAWGDGSADTTNTITLEFTRVVLAIGVFAIGVELPKAYMSRHWKSLFYLLAPVMTWGWFVSAGLIYALIPGLNFLSSLAVAACLTPTDPILAAAVVGGKWADKHVPTHLRHLLAAESACNDGAAYPFLFISLYLILDGNTKNAVRDWFLQLWLYQIFLGVFVGALIGFSFRHLMKYCERHDLIDRKSYVAQYVSLAMFTIGVNTLLGSDDLLAAFACGTAFAWDGFFNRQTEESVFSSVIDLLFNIAAFVFVGAWMPFNQFQVAELTLSVWRLIVIAILVLLLRRLPIMIALYRWIPDIKTFREAIFSGHFGPIGIGAVFISTFAVEVIREANTEENEQLVLLTKTIQPIVAFMVLCSITVHGLSITGLSLGRRVHSVSRTWSRHASLPDWTNQARHISRGDDIVINRDSVMEQGHLTPNEKLADVAEKRSNAADGGSLDTTVADTTPGTPDYAISTPPNGVETLTEWQEPHHKIIERQMSPGSDVDVIVTNEGDNDPHSSEADLEEGVVHEEDISQQPRVLESVVEKIEEHVAKIGETVKDEAPQSRHKPRVALIHTRTLSSERRLQDDDGDDGWASEGSNTGVGEASGSTAHASSSRSGDKKNARTWGFGRRSRQRRRNSITQPQTPPEPSTPPSNPSSPSLPSPTPSLGNPIDGSEEVRGREPRSHHSGPSSGKRPSTADGSYHHYHTSGGSTSRPVTADRRSRPGTADSSLRHHRLESIRAGYGPSTRDSSPSRSVRFSDTTTAVGSSRSYGNLRGMMGADSRPTTADSTRSEGDSGRVTFDLPGEGPNGTGVDRT